MTKVLKCFRVARIWGILILIQLFGLAIANPALTQDFPSNSIQDPYENESREPSQPFETPFHTDVDEDSFPADDEVLKASPPVPPPPGPIRFGQKVVIIGRVPFMSLKEMMTHTKNLFVYLRKEMGVKEIRLLTSKDYAGVLEALSRGTIDIAWLGPIAYVLGAEKISMIPLAKTKPRAGTSYRGVFITLKDGKILGIEDIKGKVFGFCDPESASGYIYPLSYLKRLKINPHKDCKKVEFLRKHDGVISAVLENKIDAGVCLEGILKAWKDKKQLERILVLGKTDKVAPDILACRENCHPVLREKFKEALFKFSNEKRDQREISDQIGLNGFLPVTEEELDYVRKILNSVRDIMKK